MLGVSLRQMYRLIKKAAIFPRNTALDGRAAAFAVWTVSRAPEAVLAAAEPLCGVLSRSLDRPEPPEQPERR